MYIPSPYKNKNREEVKRFIQENSFGLLICQNSNLTSNVEDNPAYDGKENPRHFNTLVATKNILARPIPMEVDVDSDHYLDGKNLLSLTGHMSIHYPIWDSFNDGDEVLVVFQGPSSYVSPSWYDNLEAATFNYVSVHVYGKIHKLDQEDKEKSELLKLLKLQLYKYEKRFKNNPGMSLETLKERADYLSKHLGAFRITIDKAAFEKDDINAAFKLSQDQTEWSINNTITHLKESGYPNSIAIAEEMERRNK